MQAHGVLQPRKGSSSTVGPALRSARLLPPLVGGTGSESSAQHASSSSPHSSLESSRRIRPSAAEQGPCSGAKLLRPGQRCVARYEEPSREDRRTGVCVTVGVPTGTSPAVRQAPAARPLSASLDLPRSCRPPRGRAHVSAHGHPQIPGTSDTEASYQPERE